MNLSKFGGLDDSSPQSDLDAAQKKEKALKEEKDVKRRSSKACDNCRKSKCKCLRDIGPDGEPEGACSNCQNAGIECTFLGVSRKRGPPKGYIDMIENRLHRMEALLGGLLQNEDPRVQALLSEVVGDEDTRDMLTNDLKEAAQLGPDGTRRKSWQRPKPVDIPPNQQQIRNTPGSSSSHTFQSELAFQGSEFQQPQSTPSTASQMSLPRTDRSPDAAGGNTNTATTTDTGNLSPRQRRRLNEENSNNNNNNNNNNNAASGSSNNKKAQEIERSVLRFRTAESPNTDSIPHTGTATYQLSDKAAALAGEHAEPTQMTELADVVGQLSLDENAEVRYHGRSSGLYLISKSARYQDFFWNFPKPTLSGKDGNNPFAYLDTAAALPDFDTQIHLLELFWTYVHPVLPIIYKPSFQRSHLKSSSSDKSSPNQKKIPNLLLFSIFAVAARYSSRTQSEKPEKGKYWNAGDEYADCAYKLLAMEDGNSRLSTVQALLLISFREIGIGQSARAWNDLGRAIRMAQDIGLFRDVDKWYMPISKFTFEEKQTRKRVWAACIIMDKYFSSYIGRPVAIFERDSDSSRPSEEEPDEHDMWRPVLPNGSYWGQTPETEPFPDVKARAVSCFNRSASLSLIIGRIIANVYAIRVRIIGQSSEVLLSHLDSNLATWYLELPPHLQYHPNSNKPVPPPHVLVLHCQFYCALILLHRPFIPGQNQTKPPSTFPSHSIASTAANAIANIVDTHSSKYGLEQANPFLTYYVFSAAIMLVYNATLDPSLEGISKRNLAKCMDALEAMENIWPNALRQRELLLGLVDIRAADMAVEAENALKRGIVDDDSNQQPAPQCYSTFHIKPVPPSGRKMSSSLANNPRRRRNTAAGNSSSRPELGSEGEAYQSQPFLNDQTWDSPPMTMPQALMNEQMGNLAAASQGLNTSASVLGINREGDEVTGKDIANTATTTATTNPTTTSATPSSTGAGAGASTTATSSSATSTNVATPADGSMAPVKVEPVDVANFTNAPTGREGAGSTTASSELHHQQLFANQANMHAPPQPPTHPQHPHPHHPHQDAQDLSSMMTSTDPIFNNQTGHAPFFSQDQGAPVNNFFDATQTAFFGLPISGDASGEDWAAYLPNAFFSANPHGEVDERQQQSHLNQMPHQ